MILKINTCYKSILTEATMDRSVDSIGSCSLDVDADSTDFSDTSGSLNLPTPSSNRDITREFTSRIKERCQITQINCQQATAVLDPSSGKINTIISSVATPSSSPVKKPSYLNLACCVNGYSNLTTYDSKLRQNINKSREVSPIRPSSITLQSCKPVANFLVPPLVSNKKSPLKVAGMENNSFVNEKSQVHELSIDSTDNASNDNYFKSSKFISKSIKSPTDIQGNDTPKCAKSFIQQRVERLYGPGALAQGFYSPKKNKTFENSVLCERFPNSQNKYSKTITMEHGGANGKTVNSVHTVTENYENMRNSCDLPVLRHLRPEFRAQLPIMSPKRSQNKLSLNESNSCPVLLNGTNIHINSDKSRESVSVDIPNGKSLEQTPENVIVSEAIGTTGDIKLSANVMTKIECDKMALNKYTNVMPTSVSETELSPSTSSRNGNYFLGILKSEQERLLGLAALAEKELEALSSMEVSDEIFGYLRSASGKARLLVTQKMKQFEGLCNNNLHQLPNEKFPTTVEDLQGFWDMVMLQVDHVDSLFKEIEILKANNWQKTEEESLTAPQGTKLVRRPISTKTGNVSNGNALSNGNSIKKSTAAQKREAQRKQFMELKRKNKMAILAEQQQPNQNKVEIFVNETCS